MFIILTDFTGFPNFINVDNIVEFLEWIPVNNVDVTPNFNGVDYPGTYTKVEFLGGSSLLVNEIPSDILSLIYSARKN
jgi:hypothetical protein